MITTMPTSALSLTSTAEFKSHCSLCVQSVRSFASPKPSDTPDAEATPYAAQSGFACDFKGLSMPLRCRTRSVTGHVTLIAKSRGSACQA